MNNLETYTKRMTQEGWSVVSLSAENVILKKKKNLSGWVVVLGVVGLLFWLVPGILILLVGYMARGEETIIVTREQADVIEEERTLELALEAEKKAERSAMTIREKVLAIPPSERVVMILLALLVLAVIVYVA